MNQLSHLSKMKENGTIKAFTFFHSFQVHPSETFFMAKEKLWENCVGRKFFTKESAKGIQNLKLGNSWRCEYFQF
jgi:hypothetical protein